MSENIARKLVLQVDVKGNADRELKKTDKSSQKLLKSSQKTSKEIARAEKQYSKIYSSTKKIFDQVSKNYPILNRSVMGVVNGIEKMTKGVKGYNKELKKSQSLSPGKPSSVLGGSAKSVSKSKKNKQEDNTTGEGGIIGAISKIPFIGSLVSGIVSIVSTVDKLATEAQQIVEDQNKSFDKVKFQLGNLGTLPDSIVEMGDKWAINKQDMYEMANVGAKNLLSVGTIKKVMDSILANSRALGMDESGVMEAYGKTASTGSRDFLDINRSALINAGYGKDVMKWQKQLQVYQGVIAGSENNPLLVKKIQPLIEKLEGEMMKKVGKKANDQTLKPYQKERADFNAEKLKIKAQYLYVTALGKDGKVADNNKGESKNTYNVQYNNGQVEKRVNRTIDQEIKDNAFMFL